MIGDWRDPPTSPTVSIDIGVFSKVVAFFCLSREPIWRLWEAEEGMWGQRNFINGACMFLWDPKKWDDWYGSWGSGWDQDWAM
eukprot:228589-Amorphochlora_amoeboformis.AAC.1